MVENPLKGMPSPDLSEAMSILEAYCTLQDCPGSVKDAIKEIGVLLKYTQFLETQLKILWDALQEKSKYGPVNRSPDGELL